jgi:hypothetical protein
MISVNSSPPERMSTSSTRAQRWISRAVFDDQAVAFLQAEYVVDQVEAVDVAHGHRERQVPGLVQSDADALVVAPLLRPVIAGRARL